jgi:hypothetical protein
MFMMARDTVKDKNEMQLVFDSDTGASPEREVVAILEAGTLSTSVQSLIVAQKIFSFNQSNSSKIFRSKFAR